MTDKNNDSDPAVTMTSLDLRISFANTYILHGPLSFLLAANK